MTGSINTPAFIKSQQDKSAQESSSQLKKIFEDEKKN